MTRTERAAIYKIIAASREYDAETMRIGRDGRVTALKNADKTGAGNDDTRYLLGHAADMLAGAERQRRLVAAIKGGLNDAVE